MLFNNEPKQHLIILATLITGAKRYFYVENLPSSNLNYLDTNKIPLRCYIVDNVHLGGSVIIRDKSQSINIHLNNLLGYSNVTKDITVMSENEFNRFTSNLCHDCFKWKTPYCKLKYGGDNICESYTKMSHNKIDPVPILNEKKSISYLIRKTKIYITNLLGRK